jgi:hypothetical protein
MESSRAMGAYVAEEPKQTPAKQTPAKKAVPRASAAKQPDPKQPDPEPGASPAAAVPRWRRIIAATLLVIGVVLVPLSLSAVWVRNTLLNTDNYVATVAPLAQSPNIQQGVADRVTTALFADGTVETKVEGALPKRAKILAAPITGGLQTFTNTAALKLVQSSQFQTLWENVNRRAHAAVVDVLTGGGSRVSTKNGTVELKVKTIFDNVKKRLDAKGITVFDSVQLPTKYQTVVLFQSKELEQVQGGVDLLQTMAWVLPFILLACFGGAIALSSNRRRTIMRAGIWVAVAVGFQLALLSVGRNFYLDAITNAGLRRGSAGDVWDQLTTFLRQSGWTVIAVALVVAIAAWIAGPSRMAGRIRALWNRALAGAGAKADDSDVATGSIANFVARSKTALRLVGVAIAVAILILWNHPKPGTVLGVVILLLLYLGLVEFLGRAGDVGAAGSDAESESPSESAKV